MRSTRWLTVTVLMALGAGCAGNDVASARARWEKRSARDYALSWKKDCYCDPSAVRPIRLTVSNREIASAVYIDDRQPVGGRVLANLTTVDGVFDLIQDAPGMVEVQYDPTWSFPSVVMVDGGLSSLDNGYVLRLSDFERRP